jgi:hypothetical protein
MLKCIFRSVQGIAMKASTYDVDIEEIDEEEEEEEELELKDKLICDLHNVHIL